MKKSRRILPAFLPTILQVSPCVHLEPKTLTNRLQLQEKNWQNRHLCRDQTYTNGPLCTDKSTQLSRIKVSTRPKKMCVYLFFFFFFDDGEGRKGRVRCVRGREVASFPFRAQTSQSILTQTTGNEDWVKTENCRLKISEH